MKKPKKTGKQIRKAKKMVFEYRTAPNPFPPPAQEAAGLKYDEGKPGLHLLPPDALFAITSILDYGAKKYAPRNWEKGMQWGRVYRATLSHLFKWWMGDTVDEDTGKSHLWHAGCCILFLIAYELRGIGTDDRPITTLPPEALNQ